MRLGSFTSHFSYFACTLVRRVEGGVAPRSGERPLPFVTVQNIVS